MTHKLATDHVAVPDQAPVINGWSDEIVIERREIVGRIPLSLNGSENPIKEAFHMAADYATEELADNGNAIRMQFDFSGTTFHCEFSAMRKSYNDQPR